MLTEPPASRRSKKMELGPSMRDAARRKNLLNQPADGTSQSDEADADTIADDWPESYWEDPPGGRAEEEMCAQLDFATTHAFRKMSPVFNAGSGKPSIEIDAAENFAPDSQMPLPKKAFPHGETFGHIVIARFPNSGETWTRCGPKPRPSLVLGSTIRRDYPHLVLAYGTKIEGDREKQWGPHLRIDDAREVRALGLSKPTKFFLSRLAILPLSSKFISVKEQKHVVTGKLSPHRQAELRSIICEIGKLCRIVGAIAGNDYAFCDKTRRMLRDLKDPNIEKDIERKFRAARRAMQNHFTGSRKWS